MLCELLTTNTVALLAILGVLLNLWWTRRPHNIPPGPPALPVIGNLASLTGDPMKAIEKLRRKYGDVYSLYLGNYLAVFVHGYKNLKEVLVTKGDEFSDRPNLFLTDQIQEGKGLGGTSGRVWKDQRRFALHTLRDFGFGRSSLEGKIQEEIEALLRCIEKKDGRPFDSGTLLHTSTANIICSIVFGQRFDHDDPTFKSYLGYVVENFNAIGMAGPLNFLPWLRYLPGDLFKYHKVLSNVAEVEKYIREVMQSHKETFDPNNLRDFIDAYLLEMKRRQTEDGLSTFHEEQLLKVIGDLFVTGTDTTATTIKWTFLYMVTYPEVQTKMREEIHSVIGNQRLPSVTDRPKLPYIEATLLEIQRMADIAPLGIPHAASVDTSLAGYSIPKGTIIMPIISSALHDPETWPEPDVFNPNRFFDINGSSKKPEQFIPFSAGKRVCLGESLAKMELFLFVTAIIQRFTIRRPEGAPLPSLEGIVGLTRAPRPYEICAISNAHDCINLC